MPVGKLAQCWHSSHFPWILSKGISLPTISARSRRISPTFEHQTEPETLGTSQLLRICLTSRAEAALRALSLLLFLSATGSFSPEFLYQDISLAVAISFQLKGQGTRHRSLLCSAAWGKSSESKSGVQDPQSPPLHPGAVSATQLPGPSVTQL